MKFVVSRDVILSELNTLSGAISTNSVLPILEDFLFDIQGNDLMISASDLETAMTSRIKIDSTDSGKVAIPARILLDTLKALPDQPLEFNINDNNLAIEIITQNGHYKLTGEDGDEFPQTPSAEDTMEISVEPALLHRAITNTLFAVGTDDLRPAMSGVFFSTDQNGTNFVATDAHKLVKFSSGNVTSSQFSSFILPKKALGLVKNALAKTNEEVHISFNEKNAFFRFGQLQLSCRLIDARFPDYNNVIPRNNELDLTINRSNFYNALRRIAIYSSKSTYQVVLKLSQDTLELSAEDIDFSNAASETLFCEYQGEPMDIAFNAKFLLEILSVLDSEEITLKLSTPTRAGIIVPTEMNENEDILMLIMPIMMNV
ncbi:MAG: DNA polymerase III subunit beta [Chitinophagales bacterium]|nr:DNA polymerase III subunit beta [Bacteroidota bacterium]MCB9043515.1 DNA polymerase III subunit beta [Chitinophagales bacterium]